MPPLIREEVAEMAKKGSFHKEVDRWLASASKPKKPRNNATPTGNAHRSKYDPNFHVRVNTGKKPQHHRVTPDARGLGTYAIGEYQAAANKDAKKRKKK